MRSQVYSFDVFDTALVRTLARPSDVFSLLGARIAEGMGASGAVDLREDFAHVRADAERRARAAAAPREDCTLTEIWRECRKAWRALPDWANASLELDVERQVLGANPDVLARVRAFYQAGMRVVFVSDTYLPQSFVHERLCAAGYDVKLASVYCSSEIGLLKSTGRLFEHVCAAEGIKPNALCHLGDNFESDVKRARKLGVRARLYTKTLANVSEQEIAEIATEPHAGALAGAMRVARLRRAASGAGDFVTSFLAPFCFVWAAWAWTQAQRDGAVNVFCLSRDGYLVWRALSGLSQVRRSISARYLKISRRALAQATPELGAVGRLWMSKSWSERSIGDVATILGLDQTFLSAALAAQGLNWTRDRRLRDQREVETFVAAIDVALSQGADLGRADRLETLRAYLREQGLGETGPFTLLDIGWLLNMQAAMSAVFDPRMHADWRGGYYLGLCDGRASPDLAGTARALHYQRPAAPNAAHDYVFDRIILLEHLLGVAPHGSVLTFTRAQSGGVEASEAPISKGSKKWAEELGDAVEQFAVENAHLCDAVGQTQVARAVSKGLCRSFIEHPAAFDLSALRPLKVESDQRDEGSRALLSGWEIGDVARQVMPYRWRKRTADGPSLWPEAAWLNTHPSQKALLRSIWGAKALLGGVKRGLQVRT